MDTELRQAKNVIWACKEATVSQVVLSAILNLSDSLSGVPWIDSEASTERLFRRELPDGVIIRPSLYMENKLS